MAELSGELATVTDELGAVSSGLDKKTRNPDLGPISIYVVLCDFCQFWVNGLDLNRFCAPEHICEL